MTLLPQKGIKTSSMDVWWENSGCLVVMIRLNGFPHLRFILGLLKPLFDKRAGRKSGGNDTQQTGKTVVTFQLSSK